MGSADFCSASIGVGSADFFSASIRVGLAGADCKGKDASRSGDMNFDG